MPKYTGLLIDLDDTILRSYERYDPALSEVVSVISKRLGSVDEEKIFEAFKRERKSLRLLMPSLSVGHSRLIAFRNTLDKIGIKYRLDQLADVEDIFWKAFLDGIEIFDGAIEALDILRENGVKVIVVSDGDLTWRLKKVKETGVINHIDDLIASEEVIFDKPFSYIFVLALSRIGKKAEEVLMLGNHLVSDVHGAQQIGIRAGLFNPKDGENVYGMEKSDLIKPDFVVKEYSDLLREFGV